jgi:uncharacterized membrane protein
MLLDNVSNLICVQSITFVALKLSQSMKYILATCAPIMITILHIVCSHYTVNPYNY